MFDLYDKYDELNSSEYELEITKISKIVPKCIDSIGVPSEHTEIRLFLPETCTFVKLTVRPHGVTMETQEWAYGHCYDYHTRCYGTLTDAFARLSMM